jgi:Glycosyl transferases group 1
VSVFLLPVGHHGAPFETQTEYPARCIIDGREVYTAGELWPDSEIRFVPEEQITHMVVWDPGWLRGEQAFQTLYDLKCEERLKVTGVYSDWFAAWNGEAVRRLGTKRSLDLCDRVVIDRYGAAAIRRRGYHGEVRVLDQYLSYGRLPTRGGDPSLVARTPELHPQAERDLDVVFVGYDHTGYVWQRPWLLDQLEAYCCDRRLEAVISDGITAERLEELLLRAKVAFNTQLGTQPNMRCYEAAACGAVLLTDQPPIPGCFQYADMQRARVALDVLLNSPAARQRAVERQTRWVADHSPNLVWQRILAAACD